MLDSAGRVVHVVDCTNNVAQHFFATAKQELRRRNRAWAADT
ncbi:MAG: hypothetical protein OXN97_07415 [Bryobacterales bacterium]|nr:hypothetical protein [Bryobacterales bacterium]